MQLNRLNSTTQRHSPEAVARARPASEESVHRVEAMDGAEADRQRSLQQEMAEVNPKSVGPFVGGEQILRDAHQLAAQIVSLGSKANSLLKPRPVSMTTRPMDRGVA